MEEGELTICVKATGSATKYEKIVTMIEDSEKLKSNLEGKAEHLADKLVPYTLGGTVTDLAAYQKCHKSTVYPDGRFLLCTEAGNADFCAFRNPRSTAV